MPIPPLPPWDHNAWYHRRLLDAVPPGAARVLEVGCGAGALACELARRADHVDAVDRSPEMIEAATGRVPANVELHLGDVVADPLPGGDYDAVVSLSTLHHLPLPVVLPRLAEALRPGGRLVAIALPRVDPRREWPHELATLVAENALALAFALTGRYRYATDHGAMPVADPTLTLAQVHEQAVAVLPGARVRRLTFWRYELSWTKPRP